MHSQFEDFLSSIQLDPYFIEAFKTIYKKCIASRSTELHDFRIQEEQRIKDLESKIQRFVKRIGETKSESVILNYENEIEALEKEKLEILENISQQKNITKKVRTPLSEKLKLYENMLYIWKNSDLQLKKKLLKEVFPEWIPIDNKKQVRTPTLSLIYQIIKTWESSIDEMVDWPGLEPGTYRLRGECSTNWAISPILKV